MNISFEWDEQKSANNQLKHGISFKFATRVFLDKNCIKFLDTRKDYGEERYIALGSIQRRIFVVVFTHRGNNLRIISARKANEREQRAYNSLYTKG